MGYLAAAVGLSALGILNALQKYRDYKKSMQHDKLMPWIELTESAHVKRLEKFGEYVVRQLGLTTPDGDSRLSKLTEEYLRGDKSSSDRSQESIYSYLSNMYPEEEIEALYTQMIHELDNCILSYFAFHWDHSTFMINQVLHIDSPRNRLRAAVFSATRKQRFNRIIKSLKTKNVFFTLLQQFKAIGHYPNVPTETNVVEPVDATDRSPVLLLIGGGMGVGKSTVVKDILKTCFWSSAAKNAVVVEADAFKETDVVYQTLNSSGHNDLLETSELVHQTSTDAAESLLVTALNQGRDVIFDGTMSWEPFVLQTIAMARDVHRRQYRRGLGYQRGDDDSVQEKYWEPVEDIDPQEGKSLANARKPYRIELVGVICDAHLAVVRGVRRAIMTKRSVRIKEQLKSIKRFATALPQYYEAVDHVKLYSTNNIGGPAEVTDEHYFYHHIISILLLFIIGWKEGSSKLLVDPEAIKAVTKLASLNEDARSVYELYNSLNDRNELDNVLKGSILSPERDLHQKQLRTKIQSVETYLLKRNSSSLTLSNDSPSSISSSDYSRQSSFDSSENSKEAVDPDSYSDQN
ncbi:hypothetical protein KI387_017323 [Taxus chinensis]|uniref:Zeta toxin domain-containing protein n=1 Tax=Taxus chinensis TaxID=29808 RepID=A0AA38LFP6_TAXCH|nr:hypothetical protein KI387_017323 [Taxus chinensis]